MFHITRFGKVICSNKTKEEALANWKEYGERLVAIHGPWGFELREGDALAYPLPNAPAVVHN